MRQHCFVLVSLPVLCALFLSLAAGQTGGVQAASPSGANLPPQAKFPTLVRPQGMAQVPRHMQMGRGQVQPSGALANALLQAGTSLDASNIFLEAPSYGSGGHYATSAAAADVNGDGKPDLLVASECVSSTNCNNGVVGILLGNGDGTFQAAQTYDSGGLYAFSIAVANVNGDGKPDLLVANQCADVSCGTGSAGVLLGNGDGTFQAPQTYNSGGQQTRSIAVADVNGDGKPDLLVVNECSSCTNGGVGILLGNGNGTFQPAQNYNSGGQQASSI